MTATVMVVGEDEPPGLLASPPDLSTLAAPSSWCAPPRAHDPLLREGRWIATGAHGFDTLAENGLPHAPIASVKMIRDEQICEAASRNYGPSRVEGTTCDPVWVVAVGTIYLVEGPGRRTGYFQVAIADQNMHELFGSYGAGA
jgi:hypothetical protein